MVKKNNPRAINMALVTFIIFSNSLTYELLVHFSPVFENYYPYQFIVVCANFLFTNFISEGSEEFRKFWDAHQKLKKIFERLLHICTCLVFGLPMLLICGIALLLNSKKEAKYYWNNYKNEIITYDKKLLIVRSLMAPACIAMIWIIIVSICPINSEINKKIIDAFALIVSIIDIRFVRSSRKKASEN